MFREINASACVSDGRHCDGARYLAIEDTGFVLGAVMVGACVVLVPPLVAPAWKRRVALLGFVLACCYGFSAAILVGDQLTCCVVLFSGAGALWY